MVVLPNDGSHGAWACCKLAASVAVELYASPQQLPSSLSRPTMWLSSSWWALLEDIVHGAVHYTVRCAMTCGTW
jgi:hypothetical protein